MARPGSLAALLGGVGEKDVESSTAPTASAESASFAVGGSAAVRLRFRGQFLEPAGEPATYPRDPTPHTPQATRVRHLELTYHLGADGRPGELELFELPLNQSSPNTGLAILAANGSKAFRDVGVQGQLFLARQRVVMPRGGVPGGATAATPLWPASAPGQPLAFYQHHVAEAAGVRVDAAALLGLRQVVPRQEAGGLAHAGATNLMRKLHW